MSKKRILVAYYEMYLGGSTTSLLAFLKCIDKTKYDVDLQLYHNKGVLFGDIPEGIRILPQAALHNGRFSFIPKILKGIFSGLLIKAWWINKKQKKKGFAGQVLSDWQATVLAAKNKNHYDYAIGYMEGWPNRYVAHRVEADRKYGIMHNTFANIAAVPNLEKSWMEKMEKIFFVAEDCTQDFRNAMPEFAQKADTILNITDSEILRNKAEKDCSGDEAFVRFQKTSSFKIITVCRLSMYHKGLDRIVACAKELKEEGKDFLWYIVGSGPDEEKLKALIGEAKISDRLNLIGVRMNPHPFIKEADIMCMPSRYEGKPMVITEGMILGVPPFVAEYLSARDQIQNGIDGVIVENRDDSMAEALLHYMEHPEKLQEMRQYLNAHEYGNSEYMREIEEKWL